MSTAAFDQENLRAKAYLTELCQELSIPVEG